MNGTQLLAVATAILLTSGGSVLAGDGKALTGKQAWTQAAVSGGLYSPGQSRTVAHAPPENAVPAGARITKVYVDRHYAGNAAVQSSICWEGTTRCVDIVGRYINTDAFNGLDANRPISLVHRLESRNDGPMPLYIKSNVTVWFTQPEARSER